MELHLLPHHRFSAILAMSAALPCATANVASAATEMLPTEVISAPADPDPRPTSLEPVYFGRVLALDGNRALFASVTSSVAYIYTRGQDGWESRARLVMPPGYRAGATAELSGDTAVLGVQDSSFTPSLLVFQRTQTGWAIVQTLPAGSVARDGGNFAISDATGIGLYERSAHGLRRQAHIDKPSDTVDFGSSFALDGDTLFVGAPFSGSNSQGNVYVYERHGQHWTLAQQLDASDPQTSFGSAVDLKGRVAVVGAFAADRDPDSQVLMGAAYVFRKVGGTWHEEQKILNPTNGSFAAFVAGTDETHLYLSSHYIDNNHAMVFAYRRLHGDWSIERELVPPTASNNFALHYSIGRCTFLTGEAYVPTPDPVFDGEAYLYRLDGCHHH